MTTKLFADLGHGEPLPMYLAIDTIARALEG